MAGSKLLLSTVIQSLSSAAAEANLRLLKDYNTAVSKLIDGGMGNLVSPPPPLVITSMKMSFSANVSKLERSAGSDLIIDFGRPGNFQGEIELKTFEHGVMENTATEPGRHPATQPDLIPYTPSGGEKKSLGGEPLYQPRQEESL